MKYNYFLFIVDNPICKNYLESEAFKNSKAQNKRIKWQNNFLNSQASLTEK